MNRFFQSLKTRVVGNSRSNQITINEEYKSNADNTKSNSSSEMYTSRSDTANVENGYAQNNQGAKTRTMGSSIRSFLSSIFFLMALCLMACLFGLEIPLPGMIASVLTESNPDQLPNNLLSTSTSLLYAGGFGGVLLMFCNRDMKRLNQLALASSIIHLCGYVLLIFTQNAYVVYVSRVILGFFSFIVTSIVPVYIINHSKRFISPRYFKYVVTTLFSTSLVFGIFLSYVFQIFNSPEHFHIGLIIVGVLNALAFGLFYFNNNRNLMQVETSNIDIVGLIKNLEARWCLILVTLHHMNQNFSGIVFIGSMLASHLGNTSHPFDYSLIITGLQVVMTFFNGILLQKLGSFWSFLISIISTSCFSAIMYCADDISSLVGSDITLYALVGYIVSFCVALSSTPWTIIFEQYKPEFQPTGSFLATAVNWFSSSVSIFVFNAIKMRFGNGVYLAMCLLMMVVFLPLILGSMWRLHCIRKSSLESCKVTELVAENCLDKKIEFTEERFEELNHDEDSKPNVLKIDESNSIEGVIINE